MVSPNSVPAKLDSKSDELRRTFCSLVFHRIFENKLNRTCLWRRYDVGLWIVNHSITWESKDSTIRKINSMFSYVINCHAIKVEAKFSMKSHDILVMFRMISLLHGEITIQVYLKYSSPHSSHAVEKISPFTSHNVKRKNTNCCVKWKVSKCGKEWKWVCVCVCVFVWARVGVISFRIIYEFSEGKSSILDERRKFFQLG